jgi:aminoglycoside phosphotransferase (APT) family kinase protein
MLRIGAAPGLAPAATDIEQEDAAGAVMRPASPNYGCRVVKSSTPPAETPIDEELVRRLLRSQHPDLAELPVRRAASGWDNATYRLGDGLAVRLPRLAAAVGLLRNEQRWLPVLAPGLPIPVPVPVRTGQPGEGYPWPWSVLPWTPGRTAALRPVAGGEAGRFGRFLAALHRPAPPGAPRNDYRGVPLRDHEAATTARLDQLRERADPDSPAVDELQAAWQRLAGIPIDVPTDQGARWLHGDLHPKNLVVDEAGRLACVLDWGDLTVGDGATDLGAAWMLFPSGAHQQLWDGYRQAGGTLSGDTRLRARGWALHFGIVMLLSGLIDEDPEFTAAGRSTLQRACE